MGASALEDENTALLYTHSVHQTRVWVLVMAFALACLAGVLVVWLVVPELPAGFWSVGATVAMVTAAVAWLMSPLAATRGPTWRLATRRLLAEQPWQETPVRVLKAYGTVLVLPGGAHVRVYELPAAAREVVVRAGRVWLVGPDTEGRAAVRVDGLHTAWPARRIPPQQAPDAQPTSEPVAAMWVRGLAPRAHAVLFSCLTLAVVSQLLTAVVSEGNWWLFTGTVGYAFFGAVGWSRFWRGRRLRHTGPWVRAEATVPSWRARWNGLADGTVELSFPDGRRLTAHLDRAPLDLFANVVREQALWVADNRVVGFPHYPVVATARFGNGT